MLRNTAGQKWRVYAWDATTGLPKTGDAANITAQLSIDYGAGAAVTDTNPTEVSAANAPGLYDFDLTAGETNGYRLAFASKSATANVVVMGVPPILFTQTVNDVYTAILNLFRVALRTDAAIPIDLAAVITAINADLGNGGGAFDPTAQPLAQLDATQRTAIASSVAEEDVWTHNTVNTLGYALSRLFDGVISTAAGAVADAAPTATSFTTNLTAAGGHWDGKFKDALLVFNTGTADGESKPILSYDAATGRFTFDEPFNVVPANGNSFIIKIEHTHPLTQIAAAIHSGTVMTATADAASTTTIIQVKTINVTMGTDNLKGRVVLFDRGTTTAALQGKGARIVSNDATSITIDAQDTLPVAPAEDDAFKVV